MVVASLLGQELAQEFALVKKMELLTRSRHFPAWIMLLERCKRHRSRTWRGWLASIWPQPA